MAYSTIFFDLDGTLTDSAEGIIKSIEYAFDCCGILAAGTDFTKYIGPSLRESFHNHTDDPNVVSAMIEAYRVRYSRKGVFENRLYPGIKEVLTSLYEKGHTLCLATAKPEAFALQVLDQHGLLDFFTFTACASLDKCRETKDAVLAYALENVPGNKREMLMVGDREHDILGAAAHGLDAVGVLYGFGTKEELEACSPIYIAGTVADLRTFLLAKSPLPV